MSTLEKVRILLGAVKTIGFSAAVQYYMNWFRVAAGQAGAAVLHLQTKGIRYPILLRGGTSSDSSVYRQVLIECEYQPLYNLKNLKTILDLGANVGLSTVVFLNQFPKAKVVGVEPDPDNYRQCLQNLEPYGDRARAILGAVWSKSGKLSLTRAGDGREWGVTVVEPTEDVPGSVQAWDVPTLFSMSGFDTVDLLKIDIERSELAIFDESSASWIARTRNLCIELHGKDCEDVFFRAMSGFEYEKEHSGELVICRNIRPRA